LKVLDAVAWISVAPIEAIKVSVAKNCRNTVRRQTAEPQKEPTWMVFPRQAATASLFRPSKTTPKVAKLPALAGK
jgi:hypothetical protein